jgi:hypothetical protein
MPKYNHIDNIPSKVFFEILKTKNFQLLKPKPKEKELEFIFMQIYDDWFTKSNNPDAKEYIVLRNKIGFLKYKIATIKSTIAFIYYNAVTESMLRDIVEALEKGCDIVINIKNAMTDEVSEVLRVQVGSLEFELKELETEFDQMANGKKGQDIDFYQSIAYLSEALPNNPLLKENMTLAVHVSLENLVKEKIKRNKK